MRQRRDIPFAFTAKSFKDALDDINESAKDKNGVVKDVKEGDDGQGNQIVIIEVEEDI